MKYIIYEVFSNDIILSRIFKYFFSEIYDPKKLGVSQRGKRDGKNFILKNLFLDTTVEEKSRISFLDYIDLIYAIIIFSEL